MHKVYVVSDSTGKTALRALKSALVQFKDVKLKIEMRPQVIKEEQIKNVILEAMDNDAFVVHTLVSDEMRDLILHYGRTHNVDTIDLMGPLLGRLSNLFSVSPIEKPGLFKHLNREYFRRVETMNFAFKHDDGLRVEEVDKAEIVLLGVSRTFKTPISIYLAFKRWLVANIPIVKNMPLPQEVYDLPPEKVFCLTTTPRRLTTLRKVRHDKLGQTTGKYAQFQHVKEELFYAKRIYESQPDWSIIKVTNKSIEEIASEIISLARHSQLKNIRAVD